MRFNLDILSNEGEVDYEDANEEEGNVNGDDDGGSEYKSNHHTFTDCLAILLNPQYNLIEAYPNLCRIYAIAVAIPVTSATAERTFSNMKRIKTKLRSTMAQERLESLMITSNERKILMNLDKERILDLFAKSSSELTKPLL